MCVFIMFVSIFRLLFGIPPLEKRPAKSFFLNQYAVVGYVPHSVESYILYKSFMMAFWIYAIATALYASPLIFHGTPWENFHIFPDHRNYLPERPVDYYKYGFPRTISLPLIGMTCVYAVVLSYLNRDLHKWHFSGTRPVYLANMARIKKKVFGFTRMALLHLGFPYILIIALRYMWAVPDFWNNYILLKEIHDFSHQTLWNFLVISMMYFWFTSSCVTNFIIFCMLLLFEKAHSTTTTLKPLFKKGKTS